MYASWIVQIQHSILGWQRKIYWKQIECTVWRTIYEYEHTLKLPSNLHTLTLKILAKGLAPCCTTKICESSAKCEKSINVKKCTH
jgi:hypothetical protein